jgi:hypothetical protein
MRLGQLARKMEVTPSDIRTFLNDELDIELDENPNVKLDDDAVDAVRAKFEVIEEALIESMAASETVDDADVESDEAAPIDVAEPSADIAIETPIATDAEVVADAATEEEATDTSADATDDAEENPEAPYTNADGTITAPKVDLPGPKVVGKIELPAEVEREVPMVEIDGVMRAARPRRDRDRPETKKRRRSDAPDGKAPRSSVGSDERRTRVREEDNKDFKSEKQKEQERKAAATLKAKKEKEDQDRRKKHYNQKHSVTAPSKPKKVKKAEAEEKVKTKAPAPVEAPKSAMGKIWKWFNT